MNPRIVAFVTGFIALASFAAETPPAIPLWESGAPGSEARKAEPETVEGSNVCNIHNPTITPFIPAAEKATGTAVIICPGGGHSKLCATMLQTLMTMAGKSDGRAAGR